MHATYAADLIFAGGLVLVLASWFFFIRRLTDDGAAHKSMTMVKDGGWTFEANHHR